MRLVSLVPRPSSLRRESRTCFLSKSRFLYRYPTDCSFLSFSSQILSTSDVPHPPSYIQQRLPHTTLFFRPSPPSPPSTIPASPPSPSSTQPPELVGHCITHRDGSIGTVYVSPSVRRLGLGGLLLKEQMRAMARVSTSTEVSEGETATEGERRLAYCYVSPGNEKSRALMRSVGMEMTEECVSWAVMKVPEAREE